MRLAGLDATIRDHTFEWVRLRDHNHNPFLSQSLHTHAIAHI
jgi:hypothetical protein